MEDEGAIMLEHKPPLPTRVRARSRSLRDDATDAEKKLWYFLRGCRLNGFKFRRQHPIPPYIVDFYCEKGGLVVELDGSQHNEESDRARTRFLEAKGLKVLRFWDNEFLKRPEVVLEQILRALDADMLNRGSGSMRVGNNQGA
jgi:very-short-patch-repair endonuclease